jgi:hypothetical protein
MTEPRSPLPNALELDESIAARLAEYDHIPREVRAAAWAIAALVLKMSAAGALRVLGFAHNVARRG